jgi:peptidoglycan hydrolase CwlO-like protein
MGIEEAIKILSDGEGTFQNATTAFVQFSSTYHATVKSHSQARVGAYASLSSLATRFKSLSLAKLAAEVSSGGHFDKVIAAIDKMMEVLRAEEQDDIKHRDRCQRSENKNGNEMEDLNNAIEKKGASIDRMKDEAGATKEKIAELEAQMKATEADMDELLELRNKDSADFKAAQGRRGLREAARGGHHCPVEILQEKQNPARACPGFPGA